MAVLISYLKSICFFKPLLSDESSTKLSQIKIVQSNLARRNGLIRKNKDNTVKLGNKKRFDKELIGIKEPFSVTDLPFIS